MSVLIPRQREVTKFGYRRLRTRDRRLRFEHVLVWEKHRGPVPEGYEIHHRNGNKLDKPKTDKPLVQGACTGPVGDQLRDGLRDG